MCRSEGSLGLCASIESCTYIVGSLTHPTAPLNFYSSFPCSPLCSIAGDAKYVELALKFAYGQDADMSKLAGVQSLSGTGACRR